MAMTHCVWRVGSSSASHSQLPRYDLVMSTIPQMENAGITAAVESVDCS